MKPLMTRLALVALLSVGALGATRAADVPIAVASNFSAAMKQIAADFERHTGHRVVASYGSTGKLYAQVRHGAPFEVFLAADEKTPARLVSENAADAGSRFTYALGRLVLWSAKPGVVDAEGAVLRQGRFDKLAIANPRLAPYGAAAVETMRALGVFEALQPKLVMGENIGQAYQFAATGNAQLGFVALSQVVTDGRISRGSAWIVDPALHAPIRQDAVLLARGRGKPAAEALMTYLRSDRARAVIKSHGYTF